MKKLFTAIFALGMVMSLASCNKGKSNSKPSDNRQAIGVVDVFGVKSPSISVSSGTLLEDMDVNSEQYSLDTDESMWVYTNQSGQEVNLYKSAYMTFEIAYTLKIVLNASKGYKFTNNTAITINANIESSRKEIADNGETLKIWKAFDALDPVIHRVMIQGVTEPVGGEAAVTAGIELYNCEGAWVQNSTTATYWIHNGDYKFDNGNIFTAGKTYTIKVLVEGRRYDYYGEDRRCTFADDLTVTVNGRPATDITIYEAKDSFSVKYSFTASTPEI